MAITLTNTQRLTTTSVPASKTIKSSPVSFSIWINCTTSGGPVLDTGGDIGVYAAIVGSAVSGSAYTNWISVGNSASVGSVYLDISHASTAEEIFVEYGSTSNNTWVHWAMTYSGSGTTAGVKIYKNGSLVTPVSSGGSISTADAWDRIIIGGFNGQAQDAAMWNRVLTAAEITSLFRSRTPLIDPTSIIGYWPLNDAATATTDASGQGRTLTATGTPTNGTSTPPNVQDFATSAGLSNSSGDSAASTSSSNPPQNSAGSTNSTGASTAQLGEAAAGSGSSSSTGASAAQLKESAASSGSTQSTGSSVATLQLVASSSGLTSTTGDSAASTGAGGSFNSAGTTQSVGASAPSIAAGSSGSTQSSGASAGSITRSATGAGSTQSTGTSTAKLTLVASSSGLTSSSGVGGFNGSVGSTGLTISLGASAATGGTPAAGGGSGMQTGTARRWLAATGSRRRMRR